MKIIENKNAKTIIEAIIPEPILKLNPVIAGGFIIGLYFAAIRYDSEIFNRDLERLIEVKKTKSDFINELGFKKKFTDVDFWFLSDNPIWKLENVLLKDFLPDPILNNAISGYSINTIYAAKPAVFHERKNFRDSSRDYKKEIYNYGLDNHIVNSTYWANSFLTRSEQQLKVQFIKKSYQNIDQLFSKFDLINCCGAYYQGSFYFHDNFENNFNNGILEGSESFDKRSLLSKIWATERTFKYANRFNLEFSSKICNDLTTTFFDAHIIRNHLKQRDVNLAMQSIKLDNLEGIEDPYGRNTSVSIDKIQGMLNSLFPKFSNLVEMKNFDPNKIFLFMGSNELAVKKAVENFLEKHKDKFDV